VAHRCRLSWVQSPRRPPRPSGSATRLMGAAEMRSQLDSLAACTARVHRGSGHGADRNAGRRGTLSEIGPHEERALRMDPVVSFVLPTRRPSRQAAGGRSLPCSTRWERTVAAEVIVVDNALAGAGRRSARLRTCPNGWRHLHAAPDRAHEGAAARNAGASAQLASAKWLVMLDDDSHFRWSMPFHRGESCGWSPNRMWPRSGRRSSLPDGRREQGGLPEVFVGCGAAIRREAFVTAGGLRRRRSAIYAEEYDLCARLLLGRLAGHLL
jgi:hypothetical protein